jgi:hypothetical protein
MHPSTFLLALIPATAFATPIPAPPTENNKDSTPYEVALDGIYVKEAISLTEQAIQAAQTREDPTAHLIVGKGLHSGCQSQAHDRGTHGQVSDAF